jgi:hypothetical protein
MTHENRRNALVVGVTGIGRVLATNDRDVKKRIGD